MECVIGITGISDRDGVEYADDQLAEIIKIWGQLDYEQQATVYNALIQAIL